MPLAHPPNLNIVLVGAGNVAFNLTNSLSIAGHRIIQILGRSVEKASELAKLSKCNYTTKPTEIVSEADLYILAVPDASITELVQSLPKLDGVVVHTSGSTPLSALSSLVDNHGVFYPFQTFTKGREVSLSDVPFCIEVSNQKVHDMLFSLAYSLGGKPIIMDTEKRQWLHLSGVFSCNFVNHMMAIGQLLAEENEFDFELLKPLIKETINKALGNGPLSSQTGPAVRGDSDTIKKHVALLSFFDEEIRDIYMSISSSILNLKYSQ